MSENTPAKTVNVPAITDKAVMVKINEWGKTLADYAVRQYDNANFNKTVALAIMENDVLAKAVISGSDKDKAKLHHALRRAYTTGLSLNPLEGEAALIAWEGKTGVVVDYRVMKNGVIKLAMDTGKFSVIGAETVHESDSFVVEKSSNGDTYKHTPDVFGNGVAKGYYAYCIMKDGTQKVIAWSKDRVEDHAKKYSKAFDREDGAWKKAFDGMAKKTMILQLLHSLNVKSKAIDEIQNDLTDVLDREPIDITPRQLDPKF